MTAGHFREDLYHRLNVVTLLLPPLRERREDIPRLIEYFLNRHSRTAGVEKPPLAREALGRAGELRLARRCRELEHLVQRLIIFTGGYTIQAEELPALQSDPHLLLSPSGEDQWLNLIQEHLSSHQGERAGEELLEKVEKLMLGEALRRSQGNRTQAALLLGMPRPTLHARMQKYGLL